MDPFGLERVILTPSTRIKTKDTLERVRKLDLPILMTQMKFETSRVMLAHVMRASMGGRIKNFKYLDERFRHDEQRISAL
eukprot:scaffold8145_cov54-Attheya_sp.AAC.2